MQRLLSPLALLSGLLLLVACGGPEPRPRPRTYPRLELPARGYARFSDPRCPCSFDYPAHGVIQPLKNDSCDFDIRFPQLGSAWHITNRPIRTGRSGPGTRSDLYETYRKLIYKHTQKASAIVERPLRVPAGGGVLFELAGQVPTPAQLFVSDSSRHVFTLAFYFDTALHNDSLAPVITYSRADLRRAAESLRWR